MAEKGGVGLARIDVMVAPIHPAGCFAGENTPGVLFAAFLAPGADSIPFNPARSS
jgi:hypothetical protein